MNIKALKEYLENATEEQLEQDRKEFNKTEFGGFTLMKNKKDNRKRNKFVMETKKLNLKLQIEIEDLKNICDKLWEQRYNTQKYEDKWYDELYEQYRHTRARIGMLFEILLEEE